MAEDTMLQDAIEAIRRGEKAKAKDLLTRLIKADQKNASYWVWMSAAVGTQKERVYALQTALRADPENAAAKRGLVLLGAMPPDETVKPFPLDHPRLWEEELAKKAGLDDESPKGFKGFARSPMMRLVGMLVGGAGIIGLVIFGLSQRNRNIVIPNTITPGPSPTYTSTPTALNASPQGTPTFAGPTPLWALLDAPYTPTPLYVDTEYSIEARDYYNAVRAAYEKQEWETVISSMEQIATLEPDMADPYYYIGEAYRFMGENNAAFNAYTQAIKIDQEFGPAYLGKARVLRYINASANIKPDLDEAIEKSPDFAEAYLERALYFVRKNRPEEAIEDLETAKSLAPGSPLVYFHLAQTYLTLEQNANALEAGEKALELDRTMLETYLLLGQIYEANDRLEDAAAIVETYIIFEEDDVEALTILGGAYYADGKYTQAIETLDHVLELNRRFGKAYLYRGLAYLELGDGEQAEKDLDEARSYFPKSFEANIGFVRAGALLEHYGDCYLRAEHSRPLAEDDDDWAQIYYWSATCHEGREDFDSAVEDWTALLDLPFSAVSKSWRTEALEHLQNLYTPTPTPTAGNTPTGTPVPTKTP